MKPTSRILLAFVVLSAPLAALFPQDSALADVRTEARRHFRRGMELIQAGRIDEGIAELQMAYDTLPHPNVLYNIARAYAEAGQYESSIEYFRRYLDSDPADRDEVLGFIRALEERIAAQQRREAPAAAVEPATPAEPAAATPIASSEEIQAIEDSATQIAALAEATQSEALRQRAERLRALASTLRERTTAAPTSTEPVTTDRSPTAEPTPTPTAPPIALQLGGEAATAVYEEQVVSASRAAESPLDAPNSTTIVTAQDIRLSGLYNLPELMRRAAGVEVMSLSPSHIDVSIRGLNQRLSNKLLVLVNGRSVYIDLVGATLWSTLPLNLEDIERIEVIRGPASALYGADAFSGIVNIILREPGDGGSYVMAGGGSGQTFRAAGSVTGRSGPVAWRFSGGQERTDSWQLEIDDRRFDQQPFADDPTLAYDRTWAAADLRLRPARGWLAYLGSSVSSTDTLIYGISRLRQVWLDDYVYAQTHASVRSPSGLGLRAFWNSLHSAVDIAAQVDGGIPTLDESVSQQVVDVELDWARDFHFLVDHSFTVGVGYRYKSVDWDWLLGFHEEHHLAAYIQDRMVIADRLRLLLSARLDRHPLLPDLQFSPRGSIVYRLTEGSSVRVTGGTAFRTPTFLESYVNFLNRTPVRGVTALGVGSTDLDPEAITSFEIGYTNQESDWFALEANAYYNLVDDFILLSSIDTFTLADYQSGRVRYLEDEAAFPLGALRFANDRNRFRQIGGEVGLRLFPITGLDVYVNYSLHDTSPVGDTAALGTRARDQRTSTHKVNAGVQYRSRFGLDVAADVHWLSDQLWTEQVTDTRTGVRFDPFPLDGYTLVNGRVGYRLLDDRVELAISGTNLLGERMRQHPFGQRLDRRVMGSATVRF